MLKYMYDSMGHHVTEFPLSDFEYYMYLARVTPVRVLRHHVRGVFQAKSTHPRCVHSTLRVPWNASLSSLPIPTF